MEQPPIYSYRYVCWVCHYTCYAYSAQVPGYTGCFTPPTAPHCACTPDTEMRLDVTNLVADRESVV